MNQSEILVQSGMPHRSPLRLAIRKLRRNKIAMAGATILAMLYLLAIFAGFFSPYSPIEDEFRDSFYHPPSTLHFRDEKGIFHFRPAVLGTHLTDRSRVLYTPGTPLYIQYVFPTANTNPYIPDLLRSSTPILTVFNDQGKSIGSIYSMLETSRDSGIFSAIMSPSEVLLPGGLLQIRSSTGNTASFPVVQSPVAIETNQTGTIRLTNEKGEFVSAYYPNVERYPVEFFVRGWKYRILGIFPTDLHLFGVKEPGKVFLLGTDQSGRDIFSRILFGAQISLSIGLLGVLLTTLLGTIYGSISGYYGGTLDHWMMRFAEVLLSIPALYLILALRNIIPDQMQDLYDRIGQLSKETFAWQKHPVAFLAVIATALLLLSYYNYRRRWKKGPLVFSILVLLILLFGPFFTQMFLALLNFLVPGSTYMTSSWTYLLIIVILSAVGWAGMSRVIRGMVLSLREQEFVLAARALGASDVRILAQHVIPSTLGYVIVRATLLIPAYILGEVALSFLGVGVQEPVASWGNMLSASQSLRVLQQFTWSLSPGFFLFLTVLAYNFLGDGIRDALDPKGVR